MKDMKNPVCFMYEINFTKLDLKFKKEDPIMYNHVLMEFILTDYNGRYFIASKINKATKKGTKVKFEKIKDFKAAKEKIIEIAKELDVIVRIEQNKDFA
jgi:hypothetical protein